MSENFGLKIVLESENRYDRLKYYFNFRLPIELIIPPRRTTRRDFLTPDNHKGWAAILLRCLYPALRHSSLSVQIRPSSYRNNHA